MVGTPPQQRWLKTTGQMKMLLPLKAWWSAHSWRQDWKMPPTKNHRVDSHVWITHDVKLHGENED